MPMLCLPLTGCLTLTGGTNSRIVDTSCTAFSPITYSTIGDSGATIAQIRGHNAAYDSLCKGRD